MQNSTSVPESSERARRMPLAFAETSDETLQQAVRAYSREQQSLRALVPRKLEVLRRYDIPGMEEAVSICFWGRSGSWLLASYLDGHEDLIVLPQCATSRIYPFLARFESLSPWEKLIAYPTYCEQQEGDHGAFLSGEFALPPSHFYAAVHGLFELYGHEPAAWLSPRRRFFQFLYAAYAAAAGRCPAQPRPVIIYAQHDYNDECARLFIEDFPRGRFLHTIRDPISSLDSWYDHELGVQRFILEHRPDLERQRYRGRISSHYLDPAGATLRSLLRWDGPHHAMEDRTRAVRFEDLHLAPEATMRRLADWLGVPYRPCLLESTFNGIPYVNHSASGSWVGANPRNAARRSKNLGIIDRSLIFALLHQNFVAWHYPVPRTFRSKWLRLCIIAALVLVPMHMELLNMMLIFRQQALPALRNRRVGYACGAPCYLILRRMVMIAYIALQARRRVLGEREILKVL
jgi:hypothetical protein